MVNADAPVEARVRKGWNKFRQLVPWLAVRTSHFLCEEIIQKCVHSLRYMAVKHGY